MTNAAIKEKEELGTRGTQGFCDTKIPARHRKRADFFPSSPRQRSREHRSLHLGLGPKAGSVCCLFKGLKQEACEGDKCRRPKSQKKLENKRLKHTLIRLCIPPKKGDQNLTLSGKHGGLLNTMCLVISYPYKFLRVHCLGCCIKTLTGITISFKPLWDRYQTTWPHIITETMSSGFSQFAEYRTVIASHGWVQALSLSPGFSPQKHSSL